MIKFYGLKNCSTCRKAQAFLENQGLEIDEYLDIRETPPAKAEILRALDQTEGNPRKILNSSGKLYREMELKDKLDDMPDGELVDLLAKNGMLIKRPFIVDDKRLSVGGREEVLAQVWK